MKTILVKYKTSQVSLHIKSQHKVKNIDHWQRYWEKIQHHTFHLHNKGDRKMKTTDNRLLKIQHQSPYLTY